MIKLYCHGGSDNHGCEAIVRSTVKVLGKDVKLFSTNINDDYKYKLNEIISINEDKIDNIKTTNRIFLSLYYKLTQKTKYYTKNKRKKLINSINKDDICLSIGGDNYCYKGQEILGDINYFIRKKGSKTVLWGCSVDEKMINDQIREDLSNYSLIIARESLSYNYLKKINKNTILLPDPAFQLDKIEKSLPSKFIENKTIGINVSPLIINCENNNGITLKNYKNLIEWILSSTKYNIALIPHVVSKHSNDMEPLKKLYEYYKSSNRITLIEDCNCMELKGYISRCRFFIGARTHATIAAYSTCVPTLVVGYSIKAKGIAKDIFGDYKNYVISVQDLKNDDDLKNAFKWIYDNETRIKSHLLETMPNYKERVLNLSQEIKKVSKE